MNTFYDLCVSVLHFFTGYVSRFLFRSAAGSPALILTTMTQETSDDIHQPQGSFTDRPDGLFEFPQNLFIHLPFIVTAYNMSDFLSGNSRNFSSISYDKPHISVYPFMAVGHTRVNRYSSSNFRRVRKNSPPCFPLSRRQCRYHCQKNHTCKRQASAGSPDPLSY